jgi:hypothetical protein
MSKSEQPITTLSGLHITNTNINPAIDVNGSAMTINTQATIRMGDIVLTEEKFLRMEAALEFVEMFVKHNQEAKDIWTAIKTKKRIL